MQSLLFRKKHNDATYIFMFLPHSRQCVAHCGLVFVCCESQYEMQGLPITDTCFCFFVFVLVNAVVL